MSEATAKRHMGLKASRAVTNTAIHTLLIIISIIWLIPFVCIVLQSFRVENSGQVGYVLPKVWERTTMSTCSRRIFRGGTPTPLSRQSSRRFCKR